MSHTTVVSHYVLHTHMHTLEKTTLVSQMTLISHYYTHTHTHRRTHARTYCPCSFLPIIFPTKRILLVTHIHICTLIHTHSHVLAYSCLYYLSDKENSPACNMRWSQAGGLGCGTGGTLNCSIYQVCQEESRRWQRRVPASQQWICTCDSFCHEMSRAKWKIIPYTKNSSNDQVCILAVVFYYTVHPDCYPKLTYAHAFI